MSECAFPSKSHLNSRFQLWESFARRGNALLKNLNYSFWFSVLQLSWKPVIKLVGVVLSCVELTLLCHWSGRTVISLGNA